MPSDVFVENEGAAFTGFCDDRMVTDLASWAKHVADGLLVAHHRVVKHHTAPFME